MGKSCQKIKNVGKECRKGKTIFKKKDETEAKRERDDRGKEKLKRVKNPGQTDG